jgi:hypothetical protein
VSDKIIKKDFSELKEDFKNKKLKSPTMNIILISAISVLTGSLLTLGSVYGIEKRNQKQDSSTAQIIENIDKLKDKVAEGQIDVQKNLTDLDLVKEACSSGFIVDQKQGDGLCRELFCRMQQRGIDSKTSGSECESISNINNSSTIIQKCSLLESPEAQEKCFDVFFKIK